MVTNSTTYDARKWSLERKTAGALGPGKPHTVDLSPIWGDEGAEDCLVLALEEHQRHHQHVGALPLHGLHGVGVVVAHQFQDLSPLLMECRRIKRLQQRR